MGEPMTEAEARERLAAVVLGGVTIPAAIGAEIRDAILATTDALAVLLDPEVAELRAENERLRGVLDAALAWKAVHDRPIRGVEGPEVGEYLAADQRLQDALSALDTGRDDGD